MPTLENSGEAYMLKHRIVAESQSQKKNLSVSKKNRWLSSDCIECLFFFLFFSFAVGDKLQIAAVTSCKASWPATFSCKATAQVQLRVATGLQTITAWLTQINKGNNLKTQTNC